MSIRTFGSDSTGGGKCAKRAVLASVIALACVLTVTYAAIGTSDVTDAEVTEGSCGTGVNWSFDAASGTITISGNGAMADYADVSEVPWKALMDESMTKLVVKDGVTRIGNHAFEFSCIESVDFGNTVESIGDCAFDQNEYLESVSFGKNLKTIGDMAFKNCYELRSVTIPGKVSVIGVEAFMTCNSMETLVISDSVTEIGSSAFEDCDALKSVKFGNSIEEINSGAFQNCTALKSVVLPASVNTIENDAFLGCYSITEFVLKSADLGGSRLYLEFGTTDDPANVTVYTDMPEDMTVVNDYTTVTYKSLAEYDDGGDDGNGNTLIYVAIAAVVIIALLGVFFFMRMKKAGSA